MAAYWFVVIALLAAYIIAFYKKVKKENGINWTPLESIGVTLATYFGGQLLGGIVVYLPLLLAGWDTDKITNWIDNSVWGQFLLITAVEGFVVLLLYNFINRRGANFGSLGLKTPKLVDAGYALGGFAAYFLLYIAAAILIKNFVPSINLDQEQQIGFESARSGQLALVFISLVLLPPFVEELLMRGFLYGGLKKALPKLWAVIITSGLFAAAHLQFGSSQPLLWIAAIDTFVLSLVLIYLRDKTGRLWAPIGLHMIKNFVAFMALFVFAAH